MLAIYGEKDPALQDVHQLWSMFLDARGVSGAGWGTDGEGVSTWRKGCPAVKGGAGPH